MNTIKQQQHNKFSTNNMLTRFYQVLGNPARAMPNGQLLAPVLGVVEAITASQALSLAAQDFGFEQVATVRVLENK